MSLKAMNALLKELEKAKRTAQAKGLMPIGSVVASPQVAAALEPDDEEADPDVEPVCTRTLVLSEVTAYLEAIKKMPRQLLEAKYAKDVGEDCPPVAREWIIEKMARKVQTEAYLRYEGVLPESVKRWNRIFEMQRPRKFEDEDELDDNDNEPGKDERRFDPTMKAKVVVECPFSRGRAMLLFQTVASQPNGMQYNALVLLLKTLNDWPQAKAEAKAQKVFTKWVDNGWVVLV